MEFIKNISFKKAITHNFWLKVGSLIIAILIRAYVYEGITQGVKI